MRARTYLPNLIVALIASVGIVIGSLGPWLTFLMIDLERHGRRRHIHPLPAPIHR